MSPTTLTCVACQAEFPFTDEEQAFFNEKGYTPPKRCKPCRDEAKQQRQGGGGNRSYGDGNNNDRSFRQMFDATCASCGIQTQVPFKPNGMKPVYCRECFSQSSY